MWIETFAELADRIDAVSVTAPVTLLAVDRPTGSGKSVFARRLSRAVGGAPIVETDDFISWGDVTGWWARLEEEVLAPLMAGREAHYQVRDWTNDELGDSLREWRILPPSPVVVIDGVTSSRRAVRDRLAYAVWVEAPRDVRLQRGVARDGEARREEWIGWMIREEEFFAADGTRERAELRVDGAPRLPHDPEREYIRLP